MSGLLERTYELLDNCDMSAPKIAKAAGLNQEWVSKFRQRRKPNPGVRTVQQLHDWLADDERKGEDPDPSQG